VLLIHIGRRVECSLADTMTPLTPLSSPTLTGSATGTLTIYYDARCPLCAREIAMLRRLDKGRGRLTGTDIADPAFNPASLGRSREQLMARIHATAPDGTMIEGMAVFREAYRAIGRGWLLAPTGWPALRPAFDALYRMFAKHRVRIGHLFGRTDCDTGACTPVSQKA
jgi:predicted DCC family thiol-disulfide oxidoreductase YuxK